jgi:hypothetical protein
VFGFVPAVGQAGCIWVALATARGIGKLPKQQVFVWQRIWALHRAAFDTASIDGQDDRLLCEDGVVGPHAVGLAQDGLLAVVFDAHAGEGVVLADVVDVDEGVEVVVLAGGRGCGQTLVRVPALDATEGVGS